MYKHLAIDKATLVDAASDMKFALIYMPVGFEKCFVIDKSD